VNCDEAQERLSDYLDRALDSATIKDVEEHLASCPRCGAEAEQLAGYLRQVASLEPVDPPSGFTARVMARVREIERKPSLWQRLLFPLSIKLPIHATAVVLIGIMALYLLKRVPSGEEAERAIAPAFGIVEKEAGVSSERQNFGEAAQQNEADSKTASVNTQVAASKPQPKAAAETEERRASKQGSTVLADRQGAEKEPKRVLPSSAAPEKSNLDAGASARAGAKSSAEKPLPSSPDIASGSRTASVPLESAVRQFQANPDVELVARRSRTSNAQHRDSLGALDKSVERDSLLRQEAAKRSAPLLPEIPLSDKPQEVWLTITRAQYDQLKKELFAIGPIESESWRSSREKSSTFRGDEQLRVKVTVLPPEP
jgi:hypothetical protein